MIIKVVKFVFFGIKKEMDLFFKRAQNAAIIEFISKENKVERLPSKASEYLSAMKVLKQVKVIKKKEEKTEKDVDIYEVVRNINDFDKKIHELNELAKKLKDQMFLIKPFGDFSRKDLTNFQNNSGYVFRFFSIKKDKYIEKDLPSELIYISTEYDLDHYVAINNKNDLKKYPNMIEIIINKPIGELITKITDIQEQIKAFSNYIKNSIVYYSFIKQDFIDELNSNNLEVAKGSTRSFVTDDVFVVEAWVAKNKLGKLNEIISDLAISFEELAITKKDREPTYMENKNLSKVGEDLVVFYDAPSPKDKDPSLWVYLFFSLFFAMIVLDVGYGILYLLIGVFLKIKCAKSNNKLIKRFITLVFSLSIMTIIFGLFSGSFFGLSFSINDTMSKFCLLNYISLKKASYHFFNKDEVYHYWLERYPGVSNAKDTKDFILSVCVKNKYVILEAFKGNILLEMSLLIGIIHICLSFIRNLKKNIAGIGWIISIIGGYLYLPYFIGATSFVIFTNILPRDSAYMIGKYLLFTGIALAIIMSIIKDKLVGIKEIFTSIQIFADILSYLRIYALGLSGMIMAETFNNLGLQMPIFIGIFIIIIGHMLNLALCIMSGVIHGLRLNFIEWYHYSFEGDGKLFNPLRKLIK